MLCTFLFTCLSRLVHYCTEVIRHYLYLGKGSGREERTSIVGNYGNEAQKRGMIKIKGPRQEGNGSTRGRVLWQISKRIRSYHAIHQRARLVEHFKWEFNWRSQNFESLLSHFNFLSFFWMRCQIVDESIQRCPYMIASGPLKEKTKDKISFLH